MNEYEKWVELPEDPMTWPEPTIEPSPHPTPEPSLEPTLGPTPEPSREPELYMEEYQDDTYSEQRSGRVR